MYQFVQLSNMKMVLFFMVNGILQQIKDMEEEYKFGQVEINIVVYGKMIKQILKVN